MISNFISNEPKQIEGSNVRIIRTAFIKMVYIVDANQIPTSIKSGFEFRNGQFCSGMEKFAGKITKKSPAAEATRDSS